MPKINNRLYERITRAYRNRRFLIKHGTETKEERDRQRMSEYWRHQYWVAKQNPENPTNKILILLCKARNAKFQAAYCNLDSSEGAVIGSELANEIRKTSLIEAKKHQFYLRMVRREMRKLAHTL